MTVTRDQHPADQLLDRPATPEELKRVAAITQDTLNALQNGYVTRASCRATSIAPQGHPDAWPASDGVRRDGLHVVQITAEIRDGNALRGSAQLRVDPLGLLLDIFNRQHPNTAVVIEFREATAMPTPASTPLNDDDARPEDADHLPAAGCTLWREDDPSVPTIWLNIDVPIGQLPYVLAEELAHVIAGPAAQHGPDFQAVLTALHEEYEQRAAVLNWERWHGPLPISVQDYLGGHPDRKLDIVPSESGGFVSFIRSEHGWALSARRLHAATRQATLDLVHAEPLHHIAPRISEDGLRYE